MSTALSAVQAWWNATPAAQALTADGRLWLIEAPEEMALPYATYLLVSDTTTVWTTGYPLRLATVQISLHDSTAGSAAGLAGQVAALLGKSPGQPAGASLSLGSSAVMHVLAEDFSLHLGEGLGPDGSDCWVAITTFDIPYTP